MTLLLILIVGGVLGWLASIVMRTDAQQGLLLNIVVGVVGAMLGGLLRSSSPDQTWKQCRGWERILRLSFWPRTASYMVHSMMLC